MNYYLYYNNVRLLESFNKIIQCFLRGDLQNDCTRFHDLQKKKMRHK
jgi:hypothetical protein